MERTELSLLLESCEVNGGTTLGNEPSGKLQSGLGIIGRTATWVTALLGFLVVVPLTMWFAWAGNSTVAYSTAESVFCLSFTWLLISLLQLHRNLQKLGLGPRGRTRLFSGQRPEDPDELRAWQWGWRFLYAVLGVLLCMAAIPVTAWLSGK